MVLERYFVLFLFILSSIFLFISFGLPLTSMNIGALGAGFFPRIISILLVVLSGFYFIQILRNKPDKDAESLKKEAVLKQIAIIILLIATLLLTQILGMLFSIGIFMFVTLTLILKIQKVNSFLFTILILVIMYIIFVIWLEASLPKGVFG